MDYSDMTREERQALLDNYRQRHADSSQHLTAFTLGLLLKAICDLEDSLK